MSSSICKLESADALARNYASKDAWFSSYTIPTIGIQIILSAEERAMSTRRLATILSIDVVGYSRMMQADPSRLLAVLNTVFRSLVKPQVEEHGGRVVKLLGDGALIEFQSAHAALTCAAAIQQQMRSTRPPYTYDEPLFLRMGIHAGDILIEGQDVFGDGVNIAARLQSEAEPGGILLSRTVADLAGGELPFRLRREGAHSFKNIANPIETLSVDFSDQTAQARRTERAQSLEVQFCKSSDGQALAWTSVGDGLPIIKAPNFIGHLELDWRYPGLAPLFDSLSSRRRLIYFDARGNGLSDWDMENISFDLLVDDLESVFDAAGVDRAPVITISQGGAVAAAFAARAPERVSAIVMMGSFPVGRAKREVKKDQERAKAMQAMMTAGWDDEFPSLRDLITEIIIPMASREDQRRFAEDMRKMISPENMGRYRGVIDNLDVTSLLPNVQAPTLVIHSKGDRMHPVEQAQKMAAGIPNARLITFDSNNHNYTENDPCWPLIEREIHAFLAANE
jgi:class 3 adenylate cyclase/pimeloyl-ACP methyl ester carboxylesterase